MRQLFSNTLAVGLGLCVGIAVCMGVQVLAGLPVPPPTDRSPWLAERLLASMATPATVPHFGLLGAHALGSFCGAAVAAGLAASHSLIAALAIGFTMLSFGIANVLALELPFWFEVADLNLAYIPMAWLGWRSVGRTRRHAD